MQVSTGQLAPFLIIQGGSHHSLFPWKPPWHSYTKHSDIKEKKSMLSCWRIIFPITLRARLCRISVRRGLAANGFEIISISLSIEQFPYWKLSVLFCWIKLHFNELKASSLHLIVCHSHILNASASLTFMQCFVLAQLLHLHLLLMLYLNMCYMYASYSYTVTWWASKSCKQSDSLECLWTLTYFFKVIVFFEYSNLGCITKKQVLIPNAIIPLSFKRSHQKKMHPVKLECVCILSTPILDTT